MQIQISISRGSLENIIQKSLIKQNAGARCVNEDEENGGKRTGAYIRGCAREREREIYVSPSRMTPLSVDLIPVTNNLSLADFYILLGRRHDKSTTREPRGCEPPAL